MNNIIVTDPFHSPTILQNTMPNIDIENGNNIIVADPVRNHTNDYITNNWMIFIKSVGITFVVIIVLGLIALEITFLVFSIKALVITSVNDVNHVCSKSHLWEYLLVALICSFILPCGLNEKKTDTLLKIYCDTFLQFGFRIAFVLWGIHEIFDVDCVSYLNDTLLYKVSFIYVILNIIILGLTTIVLFMFLFVKSSLV